MGIGFVSLAMAKNDTMNIATEFSRFPGGRFRADGPHSGEEFRDDFLAPRLRACDHLSVVLDGVAGLPSSFLEEAFGGLVRKHGFTPEHLETALEFVASTPRMSSYPHTIRRYIERARPQ
jgi:hypothetical protein